MALIVFIPAHVPRGNARRRWKGSAELCKAFEHDRVRPWEIKSFSEKRGNQNCITV
jgi:predicted amidophosphoribosyltransferase